MIRSLPGLPSRTMFSECSAAAAARVCLDADAGEDAEAVATVSEAAASAARTSRERRFITPLTIL